MSQIAFSKLNLSICLFCVFSAVLIRSAPIKDVGINSDLNGDAYVKRRDAPTKRDVPLGLTERGTPQKHSLFPFVTGGTRNNMELCSSYHTGGPFGSSTNANAAVNSAF
ncbi:3872_t:CDS:1, partial [Acaulospora colombiana]